MQVTETRNEGLTREFTVRIEAKDIEEKVDHRLAEVGKGITLPGFRPGKAPLALLQKRYGKAVIGEILEAAVKDSSAQAIAERGLTPAILPRIEITSYKDGSDLEYTMQIELMPEFEPADFSKIELERITVKVSDSEVDEALARVARENRVAVPVDKPRKSTMGDVAVIDFVGRTEGAEFPGGAGKDFHLELGSGRFIPGFEEQVCGAKPGEQLTVSVTFPEDYNAPDLAGKAAEFEVTVREIREYAESSVDDVLATTLGFEDLSKMRAAVRENLEHEYSALSRTGLKRRLLDTLSELHDFDVPAGMVDAEFGVIWQHFAQAREQGQIDDDDSAKSEDELRTDYRAIAERRVRLGLLLSEIGRRNNIEVTQDEINRAIMIEAQRYPGRQREIVEHYHNNPEAVGRIHAPIFEDKVTDFILEIAKVKERSGTISDLLEAGRGDAKEETESGKTSKAKKTTAAKGNRTKSVSGVKSGGSKRQTTSKSRKR